MTALEVISVHVPKCAGVSLRIFLEAAFGADAVYFDYDDRPADPSAPMNLDPDGFLKRLATNSFGFLSGKRAVHGHFHPRKYSDICARLRITFLRDPIDRLISHYYFWKALPPHGHALHNYMLANDLTIDDFARLPTIRHFYTATFFGGIDLDRFDFVGFHDRADRDFAQLQRLLTTDMSIQKHNTNSYSGYNQRRAEVLGDTVLMGRLRDIMRDDIAFYDRQRHRRK